MRMTLVKISTLGLGLLAIVCGVQVQSNEPSQETVLPDVTSLADISSLAPNSLPENAGPENAGPENIGPKDAVTMQPAAEPSGRTVPRSKPQSELTSGEAVGSRIRGGKTTAPTLATAPDMETTIYPGQAVGPVTAATTREDLVKRFGQGRLQDIAVPIGEGFTEPGTRVDLGAARSFSVTWNPSGTAASVRDFGSAWTTPEGLGLGTSLRELEAIAGPFELFGFEFDYSGTVVFSESAPTDYDTLIVRMMPEVDSATANSSAYRAVLGDARFSSQHESFNSIEPKVYEMIVLFLEEES